MGNRIKKHPAAIARDNWKKSEEYREAANIRSLGGVSHLSRYLENRLERAFLEGWNACEKEANKN
jgi:hypothetical protein